MKTLYRWYSAKIMPTLGRFVTGTHTPFRYLAESVQVFPKPERLSLTLKKVGFTNVSFKRLSKGLVTLYRAKRAATDSRAVPRFP
jgi:demethylmenaquinone methyltransferase/2-methoxy-6-polyprenyl-1,4-benzoquinol methylase